jgi:hypothetical protein
MRPAAVHSSNFRLSVCSSTYYLRSAPFTGFDEIAELWHGRVVPTESFLAKVGQDDDDAGPASTQKPLEELEPGVDMDVDDPRTELLYSPFRTSICASNTCGLWGRRIAEVSSVRIEGIG